MAEFPQDFRDHFRAMQAKIDALTTARPGPMSWGPGDGHVRFYAADGSVLFQVNSAGASVESRGALTGLTPLLDSIRAKDDAQDGRLTGHDTTLSSHNSRISTAQARADNAHDDAATGISLAQGAAAAANTAQARADNAHADAATAQSRADSAYSLADAAVTQSEMGSAISSAHSGLPTAAEWDSIVNAVNSMERWLYNNTTYPQDGGIPP